ncbi:CYTH domain-containing protein [Dendrosporobacter sp. 1207_IL3150]|uniref:CYTH domain-containing protein n=1 Tax=Dendrosporobacter sp. 1207_IL3150 TaxID=3084054 RepID=UPI002FD9FB15
MGNCEIELKLQVVDASEWDNIIKLQDLHEFIKPDRTRNETLEARYYDTVTGHLRKKGLAFRIRREQGEWVATIKGGGQSDGGLHSRMEYNKIIAQPNPDLAIFDDTDIGGSIKKIVGANELRAIMITRFERNIKIIEADDAVIELAADKGDIIAGERHAPILEVELELKRGNPVALFKAGARLAECFSLVLEPRSKFVRGLELAGLGSFEEKSFTKNKILIHIHQLLSLEYDKWAGTYSSDEDIQLSILLALKQDIDKQPGYQGFENGINTWIEALRQSRQFDFKRTIPLLLRLWAVELERAAG